MVRYRIFLIGLVFSVFALVATGTLVYLELKKTVGSNFVFDIYYGDNLSVIADRLSERNSLPCHKSFFRVLGYLTYGSQTKIFAGEYQITTDMNAIQLLRLFRSGHVVQHRLTFPEGWTVAEWRRALMVAPHLTSITADISDNELAKLLGVTGSLEGWLFPDTYQYVKGDADLSLLERAHKRMKLILRSEWKNRLVNNSLRAEEEALILASIIEKETGVAEDRAKIASVFLNRLELGMKLQSDPTVIYGLGAEFDGDLTRAHLITDTAYNTYTRPRLPRGAICSPGRASIKAAMAGSQHPYLYFVAMGDGRSHFSMDLAEHNRAVDQYQRKAK